MRWTVRPARIEDAPELDEVNTASWAWAYAGLLPQHLLDNMVAADQTPRWVEWMSRPAPSTVLVAVDENGRIGAFCWTDRTLSADGAPEPDVGELVALYASPDTVGSGAGHAAHEAGLAAMRAAGFVHAVLWVLEDNTRGIRFYEQHGWKPDGTRRLSELTESSAWEKRYRRTLRAVLPPRSAS